MADSVSLRKGKEGRRVRRETIRGFVRASLMSMLDGSVQRRSHDRDEGTPGHACSRCVMDALRVSTEGRVGKVEFEDGLCAALMSVVSASRLVRAALHKSR